MILGGAKFEHKITNASEMELKNSVNDNFEEYTEEKKDKRTGAKIAAIAIAVGAIVLTIIGVNHIDNQKEVKRTKKLVEAYTDENGYCTLPETVLTDKSYDSKYCDGEILANMLIKNDIKYCEILDEYYTQEGKDIVFIEYIITRTEKVEPTIINLDGTEIYTVPTGYILSDGKGVKQTKETISVVLFADEIKDQNIENINEDLLKIPVGCKLEEVISYNIQQTRPYSDIINYDLICDVPDTNIVMQNNKKEATLKLVKNN